MAPPSKIPSFFKLFIPENSSRRLQIPSAYTSHMKGKLPYKARLRDCNGNLWPVEVAKDGDDFYFQDGWVKFVIDNGLEHGDFLVFQFNSDCFFDFKLLGKTACEKEIVGPFIFKVKEEEEEEEEELIEDDGAENNKEDEEDNSDNDIDDHNEDEQYDKIKVAEEEDDDDDDDNDDEDYDEEEEVMEVGNINKKVRRTTAESSMAGSKKIGSSTGHKPNAVDNGEGGFEKTVANRVDEESGDAVFASGLIARPKNPYFLTKIRPKRGNELYIPVDVIKDHNIKLPNRIIIHDEEGRTWGSNVSIWKDGRILLTNGWRAFCKWNRVQKENRCLCEFVRGKEGIFLQVRVLHFQAGSWLPRPSS